MGGLKGMSGGVGGWGGWCSRWAARRRKGLEGGLADIYLGENIDISA